MRFEVFQEKLAAGLLNDKAIGNRCRPHSKSSLFSDRILIAGGMKLREKLKFYTPPGRMLSAAIKDTNDSFSPPEHTCQRFSLAEIQSATYNFHEALVIGRRGFSNVYKCPSRWLTETEVAVKRLHTMSNQGTPEFEAGIKVLSKLRHANLVPLVGYCNEGNELALIYEFMPNGILKNHLSKDDCALSWLKRLKICIGAGRGLDYL
ncbi:hypothetical protein LXL04_013415 [Taraxacum kok-saghyz]